MPASSARVRQAAQVERLAPAKINLALHVLGRRADGYHNLDTLAVFADIGDRISVSLADELTLRIAGPRAADAPAGGDNLVLRAAECLRRAAGVRDGAAIRLWKMLPAGAGFGGGSSDAAAVLHALNDLWALDLRQTELEAIGRDLGADVPMCIAGKGLRAGGVGHELEPIEGWPALPLALVWPERPVSTAAAFAALARQPRAGLPDLPVLASPAELAEWLSRQRNDLETPALALAPEIGDVLAALDGSPGCLLARMSGSGSGCFGLFGNSAAAESAAAAMSRSRPGWWVAATESR